MLRMMVRFHYAAPINWDIVQRLVYLTLTQMVAVRICMSQQICRISTTVSMPVFQTGYVSSILISCSKYDIYSNSSNGRTLDYGSWNRGSNPLWSTNCLGDGIGIRAWFKIKILQVRLLPEVLIAQIAQTEEQESSKFSVGSSNLSLGTNNLIAG